MMRYAIVDTGKKVIAFRYDWNAIVACSANGLKYIQSLDARSKYDAVKRYKYSVALAEPEEERPEHEFQGVQTLADLSKLWHGVIKKTLEQEKYNQTNAAKRLGITTRKLNYYCQQHGITTPEWDAMKMRFAR